MLRLPSSVIRSLLHKVCIWYYFQAQHADCLGKKSIMSQFNGMPKIFVKSDTQKCDVLDDKSNPNDLKLDLTQHYVFKVGNKEKTLNSLITLKMQNGMIEHHEEEWDHKPNTTVSASETLVQRDILTNIGRGRLLRSTERVSKEDRRQDHRKDRYFRSKQGVGYQL